MKVTALGHVPTQKRFSARERCVLRPRAETNVFVAELSCYRRSANFSLSFNTHVALYHLGSTHPAVLVTESHQLCTLVSMEIPGHICIKPTKKTRPMRAASNTPENWFGLAICSNSIHRGRVIPYSSGNQASCWSLESLPAPRPLGTLEYKHTRSRTPRYSYSNDDGLLSQCYKVLKSTSTVPFLVDV